MNITLPDPSLVLLIGISGSGKSTFARQHFAPTEIISSDHCRALVSDDENDQSVNQEAFEILHLITAKRLAHHRLTVIDATNVQAMARATLRQLAHAHQIPAVAIVFNFDLAICLQRNAQRVQRVVDRAVIVQQYTDLQEALKSLPDEGFHAIYILPSSLDFAATTIQRKPFSEKNIQETNPTAE
jgi:protein phosphatase